jgi:hypothetical protein
MSLQQITLTQKNRTTVSRTELFNTALIEDFKADSATTTVFHYTDLDNSKVKSNEYKTALTKTEFESLFDEELLNARMDLPVTEIWSPSPRTVDETINVAVADFVRAWDIDASSSWVLIKRGGFEVVKMKVSATIAEIEGAASTSISVA